MSAFTSTGLRSMLRSAPRAATPVRSFSSSASREVARVNITGRLGAAPEIQPLHNGGDMIKYNIASRSLQKDKVDWFKVISFSQGAQREFLLTLEKGALVSVDGDATFKQITDANGGEQLHLSIVQRQIELLKRPYTGNREGSESDFQQ
ncbi:hypothetical protein BJX70DRAFT_399954 [Aspergillus crustosus]